KRHAAPATAGAAGAGAATRAARAAVATLAAGAARSASPGHISADRRSGRGHVLALNPQAGARAARATNLHWDETVRPATTTAVTATASLLTRVAGFTVAALTAGTAVPADAGAVGADRR